MVSSDSGFQLMGEGPEAYERYMVPIHCMTLAEDLVDRVHLRPREKVLDVACGTGIVSRYAAQRVGILGHVTGVELNPAMIEVARRAAAFYDQIEFLKGSALELPVPDGHFLTLVPRRGLGSRHECCTPGLLAPVVFHASSRCPDWR